MLIKLIIFVHLKNDADAHIPNIGSFWQLRCQKHQQ